MLSIIILRLSRYIFHLNLVETSLVELGWRAEGWFDLNFGGDTAGLDLIKVNQRGTELSLIDQNHNVKLERGGGVYNIHFILFRKHEFQFLLIF